MPSLAGNRNEWLQAFLLHKEKPHAAGLSPQQNLWPETCCHSHTIRSSCEHPAFPPCLASAGARRLSILSPAADGWRRQGPGREGALPTFSGRQLWRDGGQFLARGRAPGRPGEAGCGCGSRGRARSPGRGARPAPRGAGEG